MSEGPWRSPLIRTLVIGEALVDIVYREGATEEHVGGSPLNVACGLGRLGRPVDLLTAIGPDARGERIREHLEGSGVELLAGSIGSSVTSTAVARIDSTGAASYSFAVEWDPLPLPGDAGAYGIVHCGSIGAFLQPGAARVIELAAAVHGTSVVSFDPNIRPALLGDHSDVLFGFEELMARSTVLKLSDEDAQWLYPSRSIDNVLDSLAAAGPSVVAITRGAAGVVMASGQQRVTIPSEPVEVVDTVGAGDSFMAGLLDRVATLGDGERQHLVGGGELPASLLSEFGRFAARCAAVTVSRSGADLPTLEDLRLDAR